MHVACSLGNVIARLFHRYDSSHSQLVVLGEGKADFQAK